MAVKHEISECPSLSPEPQKAIMIKLTTDDQGIEDLRSRTVPAEAFLFGLAARVKMKFLPGPKFPFHVRGRMD